MPDSINFSTPDLSLVLGPEDSVFHMGRCEPPKRGGRYASASVHVVVHRRHGPWTHVYRVLQEQQPDRLLVHLVKVYEGERAAEAQDWARANLVAAGRDGSGQPGREPSGSIPRFR